MKKDRSVSYPFLLVHLHEFLFIIFYGGLAPFTLSAYSSQLFHPCTRGFFNSLVYIYIVHYHACVANNRFIACLVANFFRKIFPFVSLRLPTRSSPRLNKTKKDMSVSYPFLLVHLRGLEPRTH